MKLHAVKTAFFKNLMVHHADFHLTITNRSLCRLAKHFHLDCLELN